MLRTLKRFIKRHPLESFLFLFNTGIFAKLQQIIHPLSQLPVIENSVTNVSNLIPMDYSSVWIWFILSLVMTSIIRFIKGVIKVIIISFIILTGLYLVWQYQDSLKTIIVPQ